MERAVSVLLGAFLLFSAVLTRPAAGAKIDDLTAAAKKEGVLELYAAPEAQEILDKHLGLSSVHVKGTPAHKFAQGKQLVFMKQDKAQMVDKLAREYGKILGFE
jgi:hypothetical protein